MKKIILYFLVAGLFLITGFRGFAQDTLFIDLRNPITVPGSPAQLQFDIYIRGNVTGTYFGSIISYLDFEESVMGANPSISASKLSLLNGTSGVYNVSVNQVNNLFNTTVDNGFNLFGFPPNNFVELPVSYTPFLRVTMDYPSSVIASTTINLLQDNLPPTPYDDAVYKTTGGGPVAGSNYVFSYDNASLAFGPAPVEWLGFTAEKLQDDRIRLNWQTATEVNNDYFEVQRSVDGELFESIGKVDGAGTTTSMSDYEFYDNNYPSSRLFYRVKQVDLSGETSFSSIASVEFGEGDNVSFFVYPGLVMDETELNAELVGEITEYYDFVIVDQLGKTIYTAQIGNNNPRLKIPVDHLADGIYYYRLTKGLDEVKHGRFMKVEK